jgi:hypothetical protein
MRLTFVALYVTSYILLSYYSAAFITDLTLQDPALPFTSFEEFLEDGSYKLGMVRNSSTLDYFKVSCCSVLLCLIQFSDAENVDYNIHWLDTKHHSRSTKYL